MSILKEEIGRYAPHPTQVLMHREKNMGTASGRERCNLQVHGADLDHSQQGEYRKHTLGEENEKKNKHIYIYMMKENKRSKGNADRGTHVGNRVSF